MLLFAATAAAGSNSLRCGARTAQVGDNELSVLNSCGEPYLKKTYEVPVGGRRGVVGYKDVEKWYYNRGGHCVVNR